MRKKIKAKEGVVMALITNEIRDLLYHSGKISSKREHNHIYHNGVYQLIFQLDRTGKVTLSCGFIENNHVHIERYTDLDFENCIRDENDELDKIFDELEDRLYFARTRKLQGKYGDSQLALNDILKGLMRANEYLIQYGQRKSIEDESVKWINQDRRT